MSDRTIRTIIIFDPNEADSRAMRDALADFPNADMIEVQRVRSVLPGIRATPSVGVLLWSSDLQGLRSDVEAFAAYIKGEAEIKEAAHVSQRYVPDEVAYAQPRVLFAEWSGDSVAYIAGDCCMYGEDIYRCLTAHTSQSDWTPDAAVSLWVRIADPTEAWPEWIQPLGAHDAYASGAKVAHNGKHWTSEIDANTYEPGVYGWKEVTE